MTIKKQAFSILTMLSLLGTIVVAPVLITSWKTVFAQNPISFINVSGQLDFIHFCDRCDGLAGAVWFDYNNDRLLDILLTNGKGHESGLMRNNGDGTFRDITDAAGVSGPKTVLSAVFVDINKDGFLDLFIAGVGDLLTEVLNKNKLYLNNGSLTFTDISEFSLVDTSLGGCAVAFYDYNDDGWIDIFGTNCTVPFLKTNSTQLLRNNEDLTFTHVTIEAGLVTMPAYADSQVSPVPTGLWGGDGIRLVVTETGATAEFDCAFGTIDEPLLSDKDGNFEAHGVYMFEQGGPRHLGEGEKPPKKHPAKYHGWTNGHEMNLTVTLVDTGDIVGTFSLCLGSIPLLDKCL